MGDEGVGDEVFIWQESDGPGAWGTIATLIPVIGVAGPLMFRNRLVAKQAEPLAEAHHRQTGKPVRLARFELVEVEVTL